MRILKSLPQRGSELASERMRRTGGVTNLRVKSFSLAFSKNKLQTHLHQSSPHPSDGFPTEIDRYATGGHLPRWGRLKVRAQLKKAPCGVSCREATEGERV